MRRFKILSVSLLLICFFFISDFTFASVQPENFTGNDDILDEKELIDFLLVYQGISFKKIWEWEVSEAEVAAEDGNVDQAKKKKEVKFLLADIKGIIGGPPPYKPIEITAYLENETVEDVERVRAEADEATKEGEQDKKESNWKYGPILFREKLEDWDKKLKDIDGSTISYSDDRLDDIQTWKTEGNLIYPYIFFNETSEKELYKTRAILPSIKWKYNDLSKSDNEDIEELTFQISWFTRILHKLAQYPDESGEIRDYRTWRSEFYFTPFYTTDFEFEGEIIGASITYEPIVQLGRFNTGSWHSLFGTLDSAYLLRFIPGGTYSHVLTEGEFANREESDNLLGITAHFEFGLRPFGKNVPWEVKLAYGILYDFTGEDEGYFENFTAKLSYWFSDNAGLTLGYEDGDQFLTKKKIDLISLGFEVRL